jgi:hypothetical protein
VSASAWLSCLVSADSPARAKGLLEQGLDELYTAKSIEGRGSGYVLSDAGVEVKVRAGRRLSQVRSEWVGNPQGATAVKEGSAS